MADLGLDQIVRVNPPTGPTFAAAPPVAPSVLVLPVAGAHGSDGDPGEKGDPGIQGPLGPIGIVWRRTWAPETSYLPDDAVYWDASSWFAVTPSIGVTPGSNIDIWAPLALQGAQGIPGNPGAPGEAGPPGDDGAPGADGDPSVLVGDLSDLVTTDKSNVVAAINEVSTATPVITGSTIRYIGSVEPDTSDWAVDDLWFDTSTEA